MIDIEIINEQDVQAITDRETKLIKAVIIQSAQLEGLENGEVAVTLVDDQRIHELNLQYRGIDSTTDVLSFAMNEHGDEDMELIYDEDEINDITNTLGDIVISIPRVVAQAFEYGHSFERELTFLVVHGFLHLLGYDHNSTEDEQIMFSKQEEALALLNILR